MWQAWAALSHRAEPSTGQDGAGSVVNMPLLCLNILLLQCLNAAFVICINCLTLV